MHTRQILGLVSLGAALLAGGCGDNGSDIDHLVDVTDEPAGANCADGGVRIASGWDDDQSGALEGEEIESTRFVCNGADGGGAQVVKEFDITGVLMSTQPGGVTLLSASITTEGPGQLVVIGSADAWCMAATDCPAAGNPAAAGWLWVSDEDQAIFTGLDFDYFFLRSESTNSVTRTGTFDLTTAGEHTIYLRGARDQDITGWFNFYRRSLTLIFLPE